MDTSKQLFTEVSHDGLLTITLRQLDVPELKAHEVLVKMQAAPINPSDMWPMFGSADLSKASYNATAQTLTAPLYAGTLTRMKSRIDQRLPIGNEGAGVVVAAGESEQAQALMGKVVGILSGATYSEYCSVPYQACILHKEGTTAKQAASSFVNPLTALSMVETMRREGHKALVHTAAASSLGIMLNKICIAEEIDLINIVRNEENVTLLKNLGAKYVLNTASDDFKQNLYQALEETRATLAFDAIGGGQVVDDILTAMESVGSKDTRGFNTYGSPDNKQVYIYGSLDISPTLLNRSYGMTWGIGGWLLMRFLSTLPMEDVLAMHKRVADEIHSTFALEFTEEIALADVLKPENIARYNAKRTGEKFVVNPSL